MTQPRPTLLRQRDHHDSGRVGMVELFFDLVFVFAVTQLSHSLLTHLDLAGAAQTALLMLAVWWVWIYTSWATNFLDPEAKPVRAMLFALMLGGLLMSASIPKAFGSHGFAFACAYAGMQIGRTGFLLWALRDAPENLRRNFHRVMIWLLLSGACWIAGGFASGEARFGWWMLALGLEIVSPIVFFWVPGMGRSNTRDWSVDGHHMAERCALFVIIALGESLLITGATFAELEWNAAAVTAFVFAFLGSVAMWWVYFDTGAEHASERIAHSDDPGRIARVAYTYLHILIVAGIIVSAVADELVLVHPAHANGAAMAAILGGPALYLLGNALFKWVSYDRRFPPLSHLVGLALLGVLTWFAFTHHFSALALGGFTTGTLVLVAAWETMALRRPARVS
ncbi:MAG TPA: low temperature requirement protein A [Pseudoxanthomonas sp.]